MIRIRSAEYDSRNHRPPLRETSRRTPSANQRRTRWGSAAPLRDFFHELIFFLALHTTRLFKPRRATQSRHSERERGGWTTDRSRAGRATCDQCSKTSLSLSLSHWLSLCMGIYDTAMSKPRNYDFSIMIIMNKYDSRLIYSLHRLLTWIRFLFSLCLLKFEGYQSFSSKWIKIYMRLFKKVCVTRCTFRDLRDWVNGRRIELICLSLGKTA